MRETVLDWLQALPLPEPLLVIVVAMVPVLELRASIPFAQGILGMSPLEAYLWSVIGNAIPVPIILWFFPPFVEWIEDRWAWLHRVLTRLQESTQRRHARRIERLQDFALITFVAIPLPITGAWSGSLAAIVFGISKRRAIPLILLGVLIAGVVVSLFWEALGLALNE